MFLFLPISDENPASQKPLLTWSLIAINFIVFFYQLSLSGAANQVLINEFGVIPVSNEELISLDLDVFSPCALGAIVNPETIKKMKCSVIAGAANNQLEKESRDSKLLLSKKIMYVPDYVINAGGLMNVANELQGYNKEKARYQVEGIYYILMRIFDYAATNNISTLEAANLLAERRINEFAKWNH